MKKIQHSTLLFVFVSLLSCKDDNQSLISSLSGTWKVTQITYSQTGNTNPDSVVKYPNSVMQLDNCELTGSNRECSGYYDLTGKQKVKITFNGTASENRTFITVMESFTPTVNLLGSYDIKDTDNTMTLSGPQAGIINYKGKTMTLQLSK